MRPSERSTKVDELFLLRIVRGTLVPSLSHLQLFLAPSLFCSDLPIKACYILLRK